MDRSFLIIIVSLFVAAVAVGGGTAVEPGTGAPVVPSNAEAVALYTDVLADHVSEGRVDYRKLCEDERLESYISYLAATDPAAFPSDVDRLAFWLNAYNAFTLKIICDNYPVDSINDLHFGGRIIGHVTKKTVWDKEFAMVGGVTYSLNHIEHDIVRPVFADPRAHFALVCAAISCPVLRSEAYRGDRLDEQLDDQGRVFFAQTGKNRFDVEAKTAYLSKILDWYQGDFGDGDEEVLRYVARFLPENLASEILADPAGWKVKHTKYDWSLNDR
jgi:hypothetical protein